MTDPCRNIFAIGNRKYQLVRFFRSEAKYVPTIRPRFYRMTLNRVWSFLMDTQTQRAMLLQLSSGFLDRSSASAAHAVKVPVTEFTCKERLEQDKQTFFRDTPLLLGLSTDLPDNDTYLCSLIHI